VELSRPVPLAAPLRDRVTDELTAAGCDGWLWAQVTGAPETGRGLLPDATVPTASMYKLHVLGAVCRAFDTGDLDPAARVTADPAAGPSWAVGLTQFADPVEMSVRDLVRQMIMVSDNLAARQLLGLLPTTALADVAAAVGLRHTTVVDPRSPAGQLPPVPAGSTGAEDAVRHVGTDPDAVAEPSLFFSTSTARELCATLDWFRGPDLSPGTAAYARGVLGSQVLRSRIPSGFPATGVTFHGKTGTVGAFRGETAEVAVAGEPAVTVSVMVRSARSGSNLPGVDASIGRLARILVDDVRSTF
jgi:beta-lactamase class A